MTNGSRAARARTYAAAFCLLALVPAGRASTAVVYERTFERRPGNEWSKTDVGVTPAGRRPFLGMFAGEQVSLSIPELPPHRFVRVRFALFLMNPWDGSSLTWGPDVWDLTVAGGPTLLHTTFSNCGFFTDNNEQAFPDDFPAAPHPAWTGAGEKQTLGYVHAWGGPDRTFVADSVYNLDFTFPHDAEAIKLLFTSFSPEDVKGEAWGIGRIKVEALAEGATLSDAGMARRWADLASADPVKAFAAKWDLIAAGPPARAFLERQLAVGGVDEKRLAELVAQLDGGDVSRRTEATDALVAMGLPAVDPLSRAAAADDTPPEVRARVRRVLAAIAANADRDPDTVRRRRAGQAIRVIAGKATTFTDEENGKKPPRP